LSNYFYTSLDLTEEKRFTLTDATQRALEDVDDPIYVRVLLMGKFPAGFKRLQKSTIEMLDDFRSETGYLEYIFEDPSAGTVEQINEMRENLRKDGIVPTRFRFKDVDETTEQFIYPWAIFSYKGRTKAVNLLEAQSPGIHPEEVLNNSVSLLEYKFADAIQKLKAERRPVIAFTMGHEELAGNQTASLEQELRTFANTGRLHLDSVIQVQSEIDVIIVAKPRTAFSEKDKFKLDQYIMNGGKVMWLIDRLNASLDSMQFRSSYVPPDYPINLEDILFRYGVKIEPNLVLDLECTRIPQVVGSAGGQAQVDLMPWFYHPIVAPNSTHPVVKSLDRVNLFFPSSIDTTVTTRTPVKKTVLLQSSQYSRLQYNPVRLNFEILRYEPDPTKFNKGFQPVAVLLEGVFPSLYENRVPQSMLDGLKQLNQEYKNRSVANRMIVVSDGDIAKNRYAQDSNEIRPLGYNRYERRLFANKQFLINAIEYLLNSDGVIEARGREVKLRLLDTVKAQAEKTKWQLFNIGLPLLFLLIFGLGYVYLRRRKYTGDQ